MFYLIKKSKTKMPKKSKRNGYSENSNINFGLIVGIILLIILTSCIGYYCEGFRNSTYIIPNIAEPVPNLQKLTVPIFRIVTNPMIDFSETGPPVVTDENIDSGDVISRNYDVTNHASDIVGTKEYLRTSRIQRPNVIRINPAAQARVAQRPRNNPRR